MQEEQKSAFIILKHVEITQLDFRYLSEQMHGRSMANYHQGKLKINISRNQIIQLKKLPA